MKLRRMIFGMVLALIIGIQIVSAVTVSNPVINPTGDLTSGTNVSVSFKIDLNPSGSETFPKDNTLQIFTDLNNPKWTATLIKNGVENPQPVEGGQSIYLTGWVLSYPSSTQESIRVTLEGTVPSVTKTMNKTIVLVQELDGQNKVIPTSVVTRESSIVNPLDISQNLAVREADLRLFRFHIDNRSQMGINTSAAEEKFLAAQSAVLLARNSNYSTSQLVLNNVTGFIEEGEKLLEKAWTEKEIETAQAPITKTNDLITYFKVNMSITNDPRLAIVIAKKESAEQYLSSAKDLLYMGNFAFSRQKAKDAFMKGNESLNDALNLKLEVTKSGGYLSWLNTTTLLIVVIIVVIIGIAGYFLLRNKNRWEDY